MRTDGFRRLVGGRASQARGLALFSLMSACRLRNRDVEEVFALHGLDASVSRATLGTLARHYGFPLLRPDPEDETPLDPEGHIVCLV